MTFEEALSYLGSINRLGMSLGTRRMEILAEKMGHPDHKFKSIHIAGTNGKGSTSAFCAEALRRAGYRVGLFTSPHLIQINERIQVNGQLIPDEKIAEGLTYLKPLIDSMQFGGEDAVPTFFEALTALALWYFVDNQVDWVVFECGLGGRFDATNIVTPQISIITSLSIDHERWLGSTIPEIAGEKAGIIKPGVPVVVTARNPEAVEVFSARASELHAPIRIIGRDFITESAGGLSGQLAVVDGKKFSLSLIGSHQVDNAAGAIVALQWLREKNVLNITQQNLQDALSHTTWPGRFQVLESDPPLVVDGGHNMDGVRTAVETWRQCFGDRHYDLVCGFVGEKRHGPMLELLLPLADHITLVKIVSHRSMDPEQLRALCSDKPVEINQSLQDLWPALKRRTKPVFICGSLYLVGEALALHQNRRHQLLLNERFEAALTKKS